MAFERSEKSLETARYMFDLVQRCLPVSEDPEDARNEVGRWPQGIVAIFVILMFLRLLILGIPAEPF